MKTPLFEKNGLEVFGNNHSVPIIYGFELSDKEKKEFDYLNDEELENQMFFRFKGQIYDMGEFMRIEGTNCPFENCPIKFDGYTSDTFFSGILVSFIKDDDEHIRVYTFYS